MNELADHHYKRLFKFLPGKVLVILPDNFEIIAVTNDYLEATMTCESDIVGKMLFNVFPDNPKEEHADGVMKLSASLQRVKSLKTSDVMAVQRYPISLPDGSFEERFWSAVNSPVLNDAGEIEFIMHSVEDVTALVQESNELKPTEAISGSDPTVQKIILHARELRQTLAKLQEHEARLLTAERMLNLGTWEFHLGKGTMNWSRQVFKIFDVPTNNPAPDFDGYLSLVHPDDKETVRAVYKAFKEQQTPQFTLEHRVIARDGKVRYIKGAGQRHESEDGEIVLGYVLDITSFIRTREKLSHAEQLLHLAGEKAKLGGWRTQLDSETIIWTSETSAIHGKPSGYSPSTVAEAIQYYAPEYRKLVQDAFERCVRKGENFDFVCQLQLSDGHRPWVRVIGVAELDEKGNTNAIQGAFQDISVLREAQDRAESAERQRRDVLESISDGFLAVNKKWNLTYVNQQAGRLLDRSPDELLGKNLWEEFPDAIGSDFESQYQLAIESRQTSRFQAFYPPLIKWFDVSAYPIPDGLAVYFRDVTSERQRQEELRLVDAALSRQNDVVVITEADALDAPNGPRIVYVNDAFERLTGYTKNEAIGRTPRILQGPETDRQQLKQIRRALQNKEPIRCEVLNYSKTGQSYWLELDITPLFDVERNCTHFVAVQRDITQRKLKEVELRQARERFELISRATNDVIWDWNLSTNSVWWNDAMTVVFGYEFSELEPGPESWIKRIHPDEQDRVLRELYKVIDGNEVLWSDEYRFLKYNGQYANVIDRGFVTRDDDGKVVRMVGSMQDITERMDMEQRLRESQKLEAVGHLTGGVAHDFNNLLTIIMGNAEMMTDLTTDTTLISMAEMSLSAAQRGAELTSRLLAFARRRPLDPKATNINHLVEAMQPLLRRTLPENIELELVLDPDLGITDIDASELDTAVLNLTVNARDAMPTGGKLTIQTANAVLDGDYAARNFEVVPGEYVMICVSDTGTGMTPDTLRRAFEPFFTTKVMGKGSGLGLSMVFGFTKQSSGHIKINSELNEGTTVKLYFPRIQSEQQVNSQTIAEQKLEGGTEHILIVEDDDLVLKNLERQLQLLGYRVTTATSGPEALKILTTHNDIDLLLTDIIMPGGMNGRELAEQARAIYPLIKVLFTSGYTEDVIVHHGRLDLGIDLLSKPYSRLELSTKLRQVIQASA